MHGYTVWRQQIVTFIINESADNFLINKFFSLSKLSEKSAKSLAQFYLLDLSNQRSKIQRYLAYYKKDKVNTGMLMLIFEKVKQANVWHYCLKNDSND